MSGELNIQAVTIPSVPIKPWYGISGFLLRLAASSASPFRYKRLPLSPAPREGRLTLELVSHCWQYAHLLRFQLESLVRYPPQEMDLLVTVYFNRDDDATVKLLAEFEALAVPNIRWQWREVAQSRLFRRAIGRNHAALNTRADWVWFTDCDLMVSEGTLDTLALLLQGRMDELVFPERHSITPLMNQEQLAAWRTGDVSTLHLHELNERKATGPLQIVHGDVARALGYCRDLIAYQAPATRWQKAHEDRIFRWCLGTDGVPLPVPGVWRVGHAEKGRYAGSGMLGWLRQKRRLWWDIR